MKTHKLTESSNETYGFSECGLCLHKNGGIGSKDWEHVTCKRCLKYKQSHEGGNTNEM